jgi:hypothetical protein
MHHSLMALGGGAVERCGAHWTKEGPLGAGERFGNRLGGLLAQHIVPMVVHDVIYSYINCFQPMSGS